eukprot:Nk52_evm77s224 gene=Nk52_evmTU77s224
MPEVCPIQEEEEKEKKESQEGPLLTYIQAILHVDESFEVWFCDGSRLYFSPGGSLFRLALAPRDNSVGEVVVQKTDCVVSMYRKRVEMGLSLRNCFCVNPYFGKRKKNTTLMATWPNVSLLAKAKGSVIGTHIEKLEGDWVRLNAVTGNAHVLVHGKGSVVWVRYIKPQLLNENGELEESGAAEGVQEKGNEEERWVEQQFSIHEIPVLWKMPVSIAFDAFELLDLPLDNTEENVPLEDTQSMGEYIAAPLCATGIAEDSYGYEAISSSKDSGAVPPRVLLKNGIVYRLLWSIGEVEITAHIPYFSDSNTGQGDGIFKWCVRSSRNGRWFKCWPGHYRHSGLPFTLQIRNLVFNTGAVPPKFLAVKYNVDSCVERILVDDNVGKVKAISLKDVVSEASLFFENLLVVSRQRVLKEYHGSSYVSSVLLYSPSVLDSEDVLHHSRVHNVGNFYLLDSGSAFIYFDDDTGSSSRCSLPMGGATVFVPNINEPVCEMRRNDGRKSICTLYKPSLRELDCTRDYLEWIQSSDNNTKLNKENSEDETARSILPEAPHYYKNDDFESSCVSSTDHHGKDSSHWQELVQEQLNLTRSFLDRTQQ